MSEEKKDFEEVLYGKRKGMPVKKNNRKWGIGAIVVAVIIFSSILGVGMGPWSRLLDSEKNIDLSSVNSNIAKEKKLASLFVVDVAEAATITEYKTPTNPANKAPASVFSITAQRMVYPFGGSYTGDPLPSPGTALTDEKKKQLLASGHYQWNGVPIMVGDIDLSPYTLNHVGNLFGEQMNGLLKFSEAYGRKIEEDNMQPGGKVLTETRRVAEGIMKAIGDPMVGTTEGTLSISPTISKLKADVVENTGFIEATWMDLHAPDGFKVKMKINPINQSVKLYNIDGVTEVDFKYSVTAGTLKSGGKSQQIRYTRKIYAVGFSPSPGSYMLINHPDILAAPIGTDGMRELTLRAYVVNLDMSAARNGMRKFPAHISPRCVGHLFNTDAEKERGCQ